MWKKILLVVLGLIVVIVLIGFVLPSQFEITRSISINAPAEYAYEEVNDLPNWNKWSYWNTIDTTTKMTYGEKTSGVGGWYSWDGEDVGTGKLIIRESIPFKSVSADLFFMGDTTTASQAWYGFEPEGEQTKVTMKFTTNFGYNPFMRWLGVTMFPSEMDKAFNHNLNKLKEIAEGKPKFSVAITEEDVVPISYIGINANMNPQDQTAVLKQMDKIYTELFAACQKAKVEINGHPFCLYNYYTQESMDFTAAVPVTPDAKLPAKYKVMQTNGGKAVKTVHKGSYENLETAHNELNKFIQFKNYKMAGAPWEVYLTDPTKEKDTAKWVTEIYYPVTK